MKQFAHNWYLPCCQCTGTCSHVSSTQKYNISTPVAGATCPVERESVGVGVGRAEWSNSLITDIYVYAYVHVHVHEHMHVHVYVYVYVYVSGAKRNKGTIAPATVVVAISSDVGYIWLCTSNSFENGDFWQTCPHSRRKNEYFYKVRFLATGIILKSSSWATTYEKKSAFYRLNVWQYWFAFIKAKFWWLVFLHTPSDAPSHHLKAILP